MLDAGCWIPSHHRSSWCPRKRGRMASTGRAVLENLSGRVDTAPPSGRAGHAIVLRTTFQRPGTIRTMALPGNPRGARRGSAFPVRREAAPRSADIWRPTGACRARHCAETTFQRRGTIHTMALPGNPRGGSIRCSCSGDEGGRRRPIGVVAVLQSSPARSR